MLATRDVKSKLDIECTKLIHRFQRGEVNEKMIQEISELVFSSLTNPYHDEVLGDLISRVHRVCPIGEVTKQVFFLYNLTVVAYIEKPSHMLLHLLGVLTNIMAGGIIDYRDNYTVGDNTYIEKESK